MFRGILRCILKCESRTTWLGWENWLTVEIARRLNSRKVIPFFSYPKTQKKLDLFVCDPKLAVEIKTNYITDEESRQNPRKMSGRVVPDAKKIMSLGGRVRKLLLVATCFESNAGLRAYPGCVANDLHVRFRQFEPDWRECSHGRGHISLLALRAHVGSGRGARRRIMCAPDVRL
jgi:hypothetical protein